jgi:hypothetical protein
MDLLRALRRHRLPSRRNRSSKNRRRDPRRAFIREGRLPFEQFEPRVVLANTDMSGGAFSIVLDNAPGDVNAFDGNLALYQSGLVYNSRSVADVVVQYEAEIPVQSATGALPNKVSGTFAFPGQSNQTYYWDIDASAQVGDKMLFRFPVSITSLGNHSHLGVT